MNAEDRLQRAEREVARTDWDYEWLAEEVPWLIEQLRMAWKERDVLRERVLTVQTALSASLTYWPETEKADAHQTYAYFRRMSLGGPWE